MQVNGNGEVTIVYHVGIEGFQKLGKRVKVKGKGQVLDIALLRADSC